MHSCLPFGEAIEPLGFSEEKFQVEKSGPSIEKFTFTLPTKQKTDLWDNSLISGKLLQNDVMIQ